MSLKTNRQGFTIVELLIVVVVIAILAAISIVAYTGITNRANRSAAMEAANAIRSVATTYQGVNSEWPVTEANFASGGGDPIAKLPSDICFVAAIPTAAPANDDCATGSGPKTVAVQKKGSVTAPTGFLIHYWDYAPTTGVPRAMSIDIGTGTAISAGTTGAFVQ